MNLEDYFMPYRVIDLIIGINFNTPVYSLKDINTYGKPDLWGIYFYEVRDDFSESRPFVLSYKDEQERRGALNPIHRYSELKRFELVLKKFLGGNYRCRGLKNQNMYDVIEMETSNKATASNAGRAKASQAWRNGNRRRSSNPMKVNKTT